MSLTDSELLQVGAAALMGGGGFWAMVKAYMSLAGRKDDNRVELQQILAEQSSTFMQQQQAASDRQSARSDAEIERLNQRMIASEATAAERVTAVEAITASRLSEMDSKVHTLTLEVASVRAALDVANRKAEKYSAKADRAEQEAAGLATAKLALEKRVAELEAEVAHLKSQLGASTNEASVHLHIDAKKDQPNK